MITPELDAAALLSFVRMPDLPLARAWMCARLGASAPPAVINAMAVIPRHAFAPHRWRVAYSDLALWTGATWMTPPGTVAHVAGALPNGRPRRILEIGTGTGYQTALLAALGHHVTTLDVSAPCVADARARLAALGASKTVIEQANGLEASYGGARYEAIVVNAALFESPVPLLAYLDGSGGVVIAPVVSADGSQRLVRFEVRGTETRVLDLGRCRFAPIVPPNGKETP